MVSQKTFGGLATQSNKLRTNNTSMTTTTKREEKSQSEFWTTEALRSCMLEIEGLLHR